MRPNRAAEIRELLRKYPEGLGTRELANFIGGTHVTYNHTLKNMPDAYIDRWERLSRGQYRAIWCVVEVPDHCPHPRRDVVAVRPGGRKTSPAPTQSAAKTE